MKFRKVRLDIDKMALVCTDYTFLSCYRVTSAVATGSGGPDYLPHRVPFAMAIACEEYPLCLSGLTLEEPDCA